MSFSQYKTPTEYEQMIRQKKGNGVEYINRERALFQG